MLEEEEGCARGRVRLPSISLTIYRGKGGGGGPYGSLGEGRRPQGKPLMGLGAPTPRKLAPKPGGAATLGDAPPPL